MKKDGRLLPSLNSYSKKIFSLIRTLGPVSKTELQKRTKIKMSTLNRILQPLVDQDIVRIVGDGDSTGGRRPKLYDISTSKYFLVGIDLSRTYLQVILTDLKPGLIDQRQIPMNETMTPEKTLNVIESMVKEMVSRLPNKEYKLLGAGIGAPGPLSRKEGMILNPRRFAANGWVNVPICSKVEELLGIPVIIDLGVNAAVTAEYMLGSGKGRSSLAFINCGVGIRSAFISEGKIVRTLNDREDAFGHMIIDVDGIKCDCSNYGCIDCYSSIAAIEGNFQKACKTGRSTQIKKAIESIDYKDICAAAEQGDELSREILTNAAVIIGTGLSNYIKLLNPEHVIISGPLAKFSQIFFETVVSTARKKCQGLHELPSQFERIGSLKDNAIAIGASALCLENLLERDSI